jgi:hypothetical protein
VSTATPLLSLLLLEIVAIAIACLSALYGMTGRVVTWRVLDEERRISLYRGSYVLRSVEPWDGFYDLLGFVV